MQKSLARTGLRPVFLTFAPLLVVLCVEWPEQLDGSAANEALLARGGTSVVAPTRRYTLASLSPAEIRAEVAPGVRDAPPAESHRATFAERFAAVFSFYRQDDEMDLAGDPAMPPLEVMPDEPDEPATSPPRELRVAIYDIAGHMVYLPNGQRLEAHSGIGRNFDNPRFVHVKNRGPTPPGNYDLVMRKGLFHGVRAIRLVPADESNMFGRDGMLAHSYLLGGKGQSHGCVVFRDYPAFLTAFQRGEVNRLIVVDRLEDAPPEMRRVRTASLSHHAKRKLKRERMASR
jgi:hypothetical protein